MAQQRDVFSIEFAVENEERLAEIMAMDKEYERRAEQLFLDVVFQVHKYLIRCTPADELELRGGWTSILRKYNKDFSKEIRDVSLDVTRKARNKTPYSREYHFDAAAVEKGASQSFFEDSPFDVTVINAVPQGEYLEYGTSKLQAVHFTEFARFKAEFQFNKVFQDWFELVAKEESIVAPEDQLHNDITV